MTKSLTELLEMYANSPLKELPKPETALEQMVFAVWTKAMNGDRTCLQFLWEWALARDEGAALEVDTAFEGAVEAIYGRESETD